MESKSIILIPTATIVPEGLQSIGKLPAIIYPVNQKIVFDYLLEQYKDDCSLIDVICFEKADEVHRRLSVYNSDLIRIEDLPFLGDLGYTVYFGLKNKTGTVIINFADTIVFDKIQKVDGDCFLYSKDDFSDKWTFFDEEEGKIVRIYDKTQNKIIGEKPLFIGVFKITDAKTFRECLEKAFSIKNIQMSTFYYALMLYSNKYPMTAVKASNWFDIGHIDKYYNTQLEVKAREFNHIIIDRDRGILKKTSDNKEKFIGEILWYLKLPEDIEYVRPRIFSYSVSYNNPYISMEYYSYHTVHELFLYGDLSSNQWRDIFNRIHFVYNDFKRYKVSDNSILSSLNDMYLNKTIKRLNDLRTTPYFKSFFNKPIKVNGNTYISLDSVCEKLKEAIPNMLFDIDTFNIIHGDLCFSNIMVDSNLTFIKVIDPRGKFGSFDIYGDSRYELAKLFHSIDGKYDFIIKDLFNIEFDTSDCIINFNIKDRNREYDLYQLFLNVFHDEIGDNLKKIELIESLLFLSMIPLHEENANHQMAMLGTGLEILERVLNIQYTNQDDENV